MLRENDTSTSQRDALLTHDTPPPITFDDGSFEFQTLEPFTFISGSSGTFRYQTAGGGMPRLAHIKVLNGQGTEVHYVPDARGATIRFHLERIAGDVLHPLDQVTLRGEVLNARREWVLEITSTMPLNLQANHKPGFRKHKGSHPGHAADKFRVKRIEIVGGSAPTIVDARPPSSARPFNEEFRVMIWFDPA